jgi:hypothetical protein
MAHAEYARMIAAGRLPADSPPPPGPPVADDEHPGLSWDVAFVAWRTALTGRPGVDPAAIDAIDDAKGAFLSDTQASSLSAS